MFNLIGDESIVFECDWYEIINKLITNEIFRIYNIAPIDLIESFMKISLFKYISPYKMYQIMNSIKEQKYKKRWSKVRTIFLYFQWRSKFKYKWNCIKSIN